QMASLAGADVSKDELTLAVNEQAKRLLVGAQGEVQRIRAAGAIPIGMHHGMVRGAKFSSGGTERGITVEFNSHDLMEVGCAYFALGHVHLAQEWHDGRVAYSGSTERMNFGEPEDKGFRLIEIDGDRFSNTFVSLPARKIVLLESDWTDIDPSKIPGCHERPEEDIQGALVRYRYRILPKDLHLVDEDNIEKILREYGAHDVKIEAVLQHEVRIRSEEIVSATSTWEKVEAWLKATGKDLTDEDRDRLKASLDSIEPPPAAEEVTATTLTHGPRSLSSASGVVQTTSSAARAVRASTSSTCPTSPSTCSHSPKYAARAIRTRSGGRGGSSMSRSCLKRVMVAGWSASMDGTSTRS
ncbi:hypothetical protein LCGC14_2824340, partial [marine sediment metagenome]